MPVLFQLLDEFALLPKVLPTLLDMPFSFLQVLKHAGSGFRAHVGGRKHP